MRPLHMCLGAALALLSTAASAEAWHQEGNRLSLPPAGLSFPTQAGSVSLTETKEASLGGEGVDNVAQYKSADGKVFATLFLFMPAYADAALTAYQLEKIVVHHYGGQRESSRIVAVAGVPNGALRRVYVGASFGSSDEKMVTTAAVLKAGRWIAVIRLSGPAARQAEIEAALDAMIGGIAVSPSAPIDPVAEPQVGDCPVPPGEPAKPEQLSVKIPGIKDPGAQMLLGAIMAGGVPDKDKPPFPTSIADNGRRPVCVRYHIKIGDNVLDMMQPAGDTAKPEAIIGVVNDAGRTIEMRRGEDGLYLVHLHDIARTSNYGAFDRPLGPNQVAGVLLHPDAGLRSRTTYKADGTYGTEVFISTQQLKAAQPPSAK